MIKEKLIIDTDPGIDDAVALALALFDETVEVKLITTVAGNVSLDNVTNNTLKLLNFFKKDIPVAKGMSGALIQKSEFATNVHGVSGMDGYDFKGSSDYLLMKEHAVEAMRRTILASKDKITIVAIGPMTNIALLLKMYPEVKENIERFVFMGGSMSRGNKTVYGEFNIASDPEAARIVLESGLKITMAPLELGLKALVYPQDSEKIKEMNMVGDMFYSLFKKYRGGSFSSGLKMYDSCAIAYILNPILFKGEDVYVEVDTRDGITKGATLVDLKGYTKKEANTHVLTDIDAEKFKEWFLNQIKKCVEV